MKRKSPKKATKEVQSLSHPKAKRKNIPTARHQPLKPEEQQKPKRIVYSRPHFNLSQALRDAFQTRGVDMDPQLVWQNKEMTSPTELTANMPPLYIQEKVHPKGIIDDLLRQAEQSQAQAKTQSDLFTNFNGLPASAKTEFYQHQANWYDVSSKMRNLKNYGFGTKPFIMAIDVGDPGNPSGFSRLCTHWQRERISQNEKFRDDLKGITRLQLPHRLNDTILRDSKVEADDKGQTMRVDFHKSKIGKRMDTASLRNTPPIFQLCPTSVPLS